jgi:hypothetical protein
VRRAVPTAASVTAGDGAVTAADFADAGPEFSTWAINATVARTVTMATNRATKLRAWNLRAKGRVMGDLLYNTHRKPEAGKGTTDLNVEPLTFTMYPKVMSMGRNNEIL